MGFKDRVISIRIEDWWGLFDNDLKVGEYEDHRYIEALQDMKFAYQEAGAKLELRRVTKIVPTAEEGVEAEVEEIIIKTAYTCQCWDCGKIVKNVELTEEVRKNIRKSSEGYYYIICEDCEDND